MNQCMYCNPSDDDQIFILADTIDLGVFGEYDISNLIIRKSEEGYFLQTAITNNTDIYVRNSPIKYCPMCGKKLEYKKEEKL